MPVIVSMTTANITIRSATAISVAVSCTSSGEKNFNIVFGFGVVILRWIMLVVVADDEEGEG